MNTYKHPEVYIDGGFSGSGLKSEAETRQGSVMSEYGSLQKQLAVLGETVDRLRNQLDPVLTPAVPEAYSDQQGVVAKRSLSPFAERVSEDAARIREIEQSISRILNRLEI